MTNAIKAYGTLLKLGDGATSEAFTTIAEVTNISGPSITQETADVSAHDGPGWDEHIGTLLRGGEIGLDLNFAPANATQSYSAGVLKDLTDQTLRNFQMVFPDTAATTWTFAALVTAFEPSAAVDGALTASCTLLISGAPTLA